MAIVRRHSAAGPCLIEGLLVRETKQFYVYREWMGGERYSPKESRVKKEKVHIEPCRSCMDHEQTMYPNGYMD